MDTIRSRLQQAIGRIVCLAGTARANDLHHLYVMQAQNDVPFPWHERLAINVRVWSYDRICGPINQ
jgi:hypothetical protein